MIDMKKNIISCLLSAWAVFAAIDAEAQTYTWAGATNAWSTASNWEGGVVPPNALASEVVFNNTSGSSNGNILFMGSQRIGSLTVNTSRFGLIAGQSRDLSIGDATQAGRVTLTSTFTEDSLVFSAGATPMMNVLFSNEIVLKNEGTGLASFGRARLMNRSDGTQEGIIRFQGSGSWAFSAPSYLGKHTSGNTQETKVVLDGSAGSVFTGTVHYGATAAMDVSSLEINSGTFQLGNSTIKASSGIVVGSLGTLSGSGSIEGNLLVDGNLATYSDVGTAVLNVDGDVTLANTATTSLRVIGESAVDAIVGSGGILTLDGIFVIDVVPQEIAGVVLYSGFDSIAGDFTSVLIGDTALEQTGVGEWGGFVDGYQWSFISTTGQLSSAIPEPTTVALLFAGTAFVWVGIRRRKTRSA